MRALQWCGIRRQILELSYQTSRRYPYRGWNDRWKRSASSQTHARPPNAPFFRPDLPVLRQSDIKLKANILEDAASYGIEDLERLAIEADIGHKEQLGKRLIDQTANRQDLDLWVILLDYRFLTDGERGVEDILHGMRYRGEAVNLYSDDVASDYIWNALLPIAARNRTVLEGLCNPTTGLGRKRQTLFMDMVGLLIRKCQIDLAGDTAALLRSYYRGRDDLLELFSITCENASLTIEDFCKVHGRVPNTPIYGNVVPKLMSEGRVKEAWSLHTYLLQKRDLPTRFEHIQLLVRDLAIDGKSLEPFVHTLERLDVFLSMQSKRLYREENATVLKSSHTVDKKSLYAHEGQISRKLSDEFVARAFATKAVSFNFVLNALQPFGLVEIGPLAIRQMALTANGIEDLQQRFLKLQELEIDFGCSAYVSVVRRLCMSKSSSLLHSILESDQHHEVFEDHKTQTKLLANYYKTAQWAEVNRTLAILNRGRTTIEAQRLSSKYLLNAAIMVRDWRGALRIVRDMHSQIHGNDTSLQYGDVGIALNNLIRVILSKISDHENFVESDRVEYVVGLLQDMVYSRIHVSAQHWRQVLFRLAGFRDLPQLERLSFWLAKHYPKEVSVNGSHTTIFQSHKVRLDEIFDLDLQASIIESSIRDASFAAHNLDGNMLRSRAKRGMQLLWQMRSSSGILVEQKSLRAAYRNRLHRVFTKETLIDELVGLFDTLWNEVTSVLAPDSNTEHNSIIYMRKLLKEAQQALRAKSSSTTSHDELLVHFSKNKGLSLSHADDDFVPEKALKDVEIDYVEYRDLFHPTSKEYARIGKK